jgi:PAS domain S-box-containing protein
MGYPADKMVGRSIYEFIPPGVEDKRKKEIKEVIESGRPVNFIDTRNGRIIDNYLYPVLDDKGRVTRVSIYGQDITERYDAEKKIRESEEKYRVLAESSGDAIFIVENDGTIGYVNQRIVQVMNRPQEEIIGKRIRDLFPVPLAEEQERLISDIIKTGKPVSTEMEISIRDEQHWVDVQLMPLSTGNGAIRIMESVRDITERKQMEMSLREAIQKLRVLTGITRHDVMNDLSVITLSLGMVREAKDMDTRNKWINRACEAGRVLKKTIAFTRDYEDFGSISGQWFPLLLKIERALEGVSVGDVAVDITVSPYLEVYTDPMIRKVFTTLFENSIRHGAIISWIRVSIDEQDEGLVIIYEDNGVGIVKKEKERIFEHGFGEHTGVGLYLAREILSISGFSIRECGAEGEGVRFEISVPREMYRYSSQYNS